MRKTGAGPALPLLDLPYVDQHTVRIAAPRDVVWRALEQYVVAFLRRAERGLLVRLLGTEPRAGFEVAHVRETFREGTNLIAGEEGARALRGLEWTWDPDPTDDTYLVEYALLLRQGHDVTSVHDRHLEGLFATATWRRVLEAAGYRVEAFQQTSASDGVSEECFFVCRRPNQARGAPL